MRGVLLRWLVLTAAVLAASWMLDGIRVNGVFPALLAAALLGILNAFFRPLLILLTLPVNILTLGLFTFVINALMLMIVSAVIPGFDVRGFWTAVLGALIIGAASWLLNIFIG
ncbi:MAG: phage holin family protein, partial [Deltaproteobacteria bacterium]|nr:phage holin family protein [Deltaproteobacteria bacterium]